MEPTTCAGITYQDQDSEYAIHLHFARSSHFVSKGGTLAKSNEVSKDYRSWQALVVVILPYKLT